MNQADVKVSFYLKKSEADAKGNCPVMARLACARTTQIQAIRHMYGLGKLICGLEV